MSFQWLRTILKLVKPTLAITAAPNRVQSEFWRVARFNENIKIREIQTATAMPEPRHSVKKNFFMGNIEVPLSDARLPLPGLCCLWPIAVYHQGQQPKPAIGRRRSSVRSVMFLDVM
jgi:hypothetical protein